MGDVTEGKALPEGVVSPDSSYVQNGVHRMLQLDTASESFARYVHVRANRNDAFYQAPAGGVDICNV